MSREVRMSRMKLLRLMDFMQRKKCLVNGGGDGGEMTRDVKIGKWSDGETSEWVIVGDRVESFVVMTRSSVWPAWWVGKLTCWLRLAFLRRERNCCECRSEWLSVCMLKSPVIRNSCGVVAAVEMKVWKSMRKSEKGTGSCVEVFVW